MKRIKPYITILTSVLLLSVSCSDLDLSPEDYYGSNSFWKSPEQAEGFIIGAHKQLRNNYKIFWFLGEARGGLQKIGASALGQSLDNSNIKSQNLRADDTGISNWADLYGEILNLNLAIRELEKADYLNEDTKKYYLGQTHGLRAWYYFWLYRTYGGVPLNNQVKVLDKTPIGGEELYTERSSPKEIMNFIKSDIEKSENYFGADDKISKSLWSKYATLMLKAEVYLWSAKVTTGNQTPETGDLDKAEEALLKVKNSGKFRLLPSFANVFSYRHKENDEIILTIPFLQDEATNWANMFLYAPNLFAGKYKADGTLCGPDPLDIASSAGNMRHEYRFPLFEEYESNDTRRDVTFYDFYSDAMKANPAVVMKKYIGFINESGKRIFADDIPIYRYADVLLMLAEVVNKKGQDPSIYINEIRERAYGDSSHNYTNSSFENNELAILAERDKEFVGENKRWFDILRMQDNSGKPLVFSSSVNYGETEPVLNESTESYKVLWPINVSVLSADPKVKQTPGY